MKEEEIRPKAIFDEYLRLAALDTEKYFKNKPWVTINCPACNHISDNAFAKNGFSYQLCPKCDTLFVSPRPSSNAFERYYTESESSKYWATTFYKKTAEARREKLWKPKAHLIFDVMQKYGAQKFELVDIGGGYGLFAEEIQALLDRKVTVIEPAPHLANVCREKKLSVKEYFLENLSTSDLPAGGKVFVCFELFEHLHDPRLFLDCLFQIMESEDLFIFTTLSGVGSDIRALWEHSKAVSPPHHINFFNPYSVKLLLTSQGFKTLEVSTPGKLDMDIIYNNQEYIQDRFWKSFVKHANASQMADMQEVIVKTGFSSHMMVVSRKP